MSSSELWIPELPVEGDQVASVFVGVPSLILPQVERESALITLGWTQSSDGLWQADNFSDAPNWIGREIKINDNQHSSRAEQLSSLAERLVKWSRINTFPSFEDATLGIVLEESATLWFPPNHTDPQEYDTIPHLDITDPEFPALIVLSATHALSNLYEGLYIHSGNSSEHVVNASADSDPARYHETAQSLQLLTSEPSRFYVADARRGLHGKRLMPENYTPFVRRFARAFIAER